MSREDVALSADQYTSKALTRALDVLECFSDESTALSLKEMRSRFGAPESSLYRTLTTLVLRGYLVQGADGAYRICPRVLYGKVRELAELLRNVARSHLEMLSARFDETASLSYLFEDRIQVVDTVETLHSMRLTNRPGRLLPPHCSSMGKSITAFQSPEKINRMLEVYGLVRRTPRTITERAALLAEFARIRNQGYAVDREEATEGGICVGAPICCEGKPVVAALSLSLPLVRFNAELEEAIVSAVTSTASAIASKQ
ncbi:MAG: IclR family transcriptional regulator [Terriglobia bacterium]|jgi:DNA-binding IclR family transcriptional regulator